MKRSISCSIPGFLLMALLAIPTSSRAESVAQRLDNVLSRADATQDVVQIDDMKIRASALQNYRNGLAAQRGDSASLAPWAEKWPDGKIAYQFDASVNAEKRAFFEAACRDWEAVANLRFSPRTDENDYILVKQTINDSDSWVGTIGGPQDLNLANWADEFTAVHEHQRPDLGLVHEHQRPDRDSFVTIRFENVQTGTESAFDIVDGALNQGAYDFDSTMHYFSTAFSSNGGLTIEPKPASIQFVNSMGQRDHLSNRDKSGMAALYGAPVSNSTHSLNGQIFFLDTRLSPAAKAGLTNVSVALAGPVNRTLTTDATGNFSFSDLPDGTYTVRPTRGLVQFRPTRATVTVNGSDVSRPQFQTYFVQGKVFRLAADGLTKIGLPNVSIKVDGTVRTTTDSNATISFWASKIATKSARSTAMA